MIWRRRKNFEQQLDRELRFHLDRHAADLIARGVDPEEAHRRARLALGGPEQVKEQCRDARPTRWIEDLAADIRYALRTLRRRPGFAAVALLTLALGAGGTTVMFAVINSVLLKPLPYAHPETLVQLSEQTSWSTIFGHRWAFSYPNYLDCARQVSSLEFGALHDNGAILSSPGEPEYVDSLEISSGLFALLGVRLFLGREFSAGEDRPGGAPVAIISYALWQRRFAGDPSAIGGALIYNGQPRTVVGIAPPDFRIDDQQVDLFTPIGEDTAPIQLNREAHGTIPWARLRPGATLAEVNSELAAVGRRLQAQYPASNRGRTFLAEPLRPDVGDVRATLWLLLGAVSLVLLIACANIASLLLARAVSRERELAMRAALGAGRGRLARQSLAESAVIGLAGGALGIVLAIAGIRPFVALWPGDLPRADQVRLDWRVLLFALAVSLASAMLFGAAPAFRARARDLERTLRAGSRTIAGASRRIHSAFVVVEIALACVLLVSAATLGRAMLRLSALDPGLDVRNVSIARVALSPFTLADPGRTRAAWREILERLHRVPQVESAAMIDTVPMREGSNRIPYSTTPNIPPGAESPFVLANSATPDYLNVMHIPLRSGRFLTARDRMDSAPVVVIDEVMARQAFPHEDPLGKRVWLRLALGNSPSPATVVGVVGHVRQWGLAGDDRASVRAQLYYPFEQVPDENVRRWSELMSIAVRTRGDARGTVETVRAAVRGAASDPVMYQARTMQQLAGNSLSRQRFLLLLFAIFAALAMLLACVGVYGVLAYLTSQRIPEIGVRIALGASSGEVVMLVLRQSLAMILAGLVAGFAASVGASRLLSHLVEGVDSTGLATFAVTMAVLLVCALLAGYLPAHRAARVDPMTALRQE